MVIVILIVIIIVYYDGDSGDNDYKFDNNSNDSHN
jgi:hypothetical protein